LAIAAAPIASAAPTPGPAIAQSCSGTGSGTECQSPGNVQLDDSPPPVSYDPYGGDGFLIGGYGDHGGYGGGGGFHGGGGGGHR
ncbi:MAG: hypothetical protein JWP55_920, partial [Mycobacterium sp.]|nr:hypothetical protein [Mycobacterium sp.]